MLGQDQLSVELSLFRDLIGRLRPQYLAGAIILDHHVLIVLIIEDLLMVSKVDPSAVLLGVTRARIRHHAASLRTSTTGLLQLLIDDVLFGPGEPSWVILVLDGLLIRALLFLSDLLAA